MTDPRTNPGTASLPTAEDTLALGGRVHLVKHVFASTEVLRAMYGGALAEWTGVRDQYDPERILSSRFLDRLSAAAREQR